MISYYLHPFKVFISYPNEDINFASSLKTLLELMGINTYLAEHDKNPGKELWDKFSKEIDDSDCVVVLYTSYAVDSKWVEKEIAIARTLKRRMIAVYEEGISLPSELKGECKEYVKFERNNLVETLLKIGFGIWNLRNETPHVYFLTSGDRYNPIGDRLILIPKIGKAFVMGTMTDDLVRKGRIRSTILHEVGSLYRYTVSEMVWARLLGFTYEKKEPTLHELGLE